MIQFEIHKMIFLKETRIAKKLEKHSEENENDDNVDGDIVAREGIQYR